MAQAGRRSCCDQQQAMRTSCSSRRCLAAPASAHQGSRHAPPSGSCSHPAAAAQLQPPRSPAWHARWPTLASARPPHLFRGGCARLAAHLREHCVGLLRVPVGAQRGAEHDLHLPHPQLATVGDLRAVGRGRGRRRQPHGVLPSSITRPVPTAPLMPACPPLALTQKSWLRQRLCPCRSTAAMCPLAASPGSAPHAQARSHTPGPALSAP